MSDIKFVDGLIIKAPNDKTPDFIKMQISINRKSLGNWLRAETDEWISIDIKESRAGKLYASVNEWKPDAQKTPQNGSQGGSGDFNDPLPGAMDDDSGIPF